MRTRISGHTRFGGLLGSPVFHSLSPAIHNTSFEELGIDYVYLSFNVTEERIGETVKVFRDLGTYGFNLTKPCKKAVMEYLDDISLQARLIGAVNTVVEHNGRLIGHNTDGTGFVRSLTESGYAIKGSEVTLLGAGGAACAIAFQMAFDGVSKMHIANRKTRSWRAAIGLTDRINKNTTCEADLTDLRDPNELGKRIGESTLLVNATSAGMSPDIDDSPIEDASMLREGLIVYDVIYNPPRTRLLEMAEENGCMILNGKYMLLYQAEAAFKLWTGMDMPLGLIKKRFF